MRLFKFIEYLKECLPQAKSVEQLERIRKISKSTDIGDKTKEEGANLLQHTNPIDTGIESYQDYTNSQKDFDSENPLNNQKKGAKPYYIMPPMQHKYPKKNLGKGNKKVKP